MASSTIALCDNDFRQGTSNCIQASQFGATILGNGSGFPLWTRGLDETRGNQGCFSTTQFVVSFLFTQDRQTDSSPLWQGNRSQQAQNAILVYSRRFCTHCPLLHSGYIIA